MSKGKRNRRSIKRRSVTGLESGLAKMKFAKELAEERIAKLNVKIAQQEKKILDAKKELAENG